MSAKVGDYVQTILSNLPLTADFGPSGFDSTVEGVVIGENRSGTIQVTTREGDTFTCLNFPEIMKFPDEALTPNQLDFACDVRTDLLNRGLLAVPLK